MNDKIETSKPTQITNKQKLKIPALHSRLMNKAVNTVSAIELPNRIMIMPDCSGSMAEADYNDPIKDDRRAKIDILREAVDGFLNVVNYQDTAVGICNFGAPPEGIDSPLINDISLLRIHTMQLIACGSTPMGEAMASTIKQPLTRGIIISDGDATDGGYSEEMALQFREAQIPVDCIHIGSSTSGESRLQKIAEVTGGIYAKIKDAGHLVGALKYLTPAFRGLLMSGDAAELLGATEVKK